MMVLFYWYIVSELKWPADYYSNETGEIDNMHFEATKVLWSTVIESISFKSSLNTINISAYKKIKFEIIRLWLD